MQKTNLRRKVARLAFSGITAIVVTLCFVSVHDYARAYVITPHRWPGTPTSGCCANLYVKNFSTSSFLDANNYYAFQNAYSQWSHYTNSSINVNWYTTGTVVEVHDVYNSSVAWDGLTNTTWDSDWNFTSATTWLNNYYTSGFQWWDRQGVAAHEIGHQMGLAHTNVNCAIMVPAKNLRCSNSIPQADDIAGINYWY